jgi:uncharacterized protein (DUF2141 family)
MIIRDLVFKNFAATLTLVTFSLAVIAVQSSTAEIIIFVSDVPSDNGTVACAVFSTHKGFPLDTSEAILHSKKARQGVAECRFESLPSGTYAAAVFHDKNDNGRIDLNFFGIPTEAWGVSNNARPQRRAPRFDEASFQLIDGETAKLEVSLK